MNASSAQNLTNNNRVGNVSLRRMGGFSLIESLVALSIAGIVLSMAVPSMQTFIKNNRIESATDQILRAIISARIESVKRGVTVNICRTGNPLAADPVCKANNPGGGSNQSNQWTYGWLTYSLPVNHTRTTANYDYDSDTDTLISVGPAAPENVTITSDGTGDNWLTLYGDGTTNESGDTAEYHVCDDRGNKYGRQIVVPPSGRPRVQDATNC